MTKEKCRLKLSENRKPNTENLPARRPVNRSLNESLNGSLEMNPPRLGAAKSIASIRAVGRRTTVRDRGRSRQQARKPLRHRPRSRSQLRLRSARPRRTAARHFSFSTAQITIR